MSKVSVIIPVYNVAPFMRRNVRALMEQTLEDVEFIFVDDATPDDSIDILMEELENYPHRKASVTILRHERNKGLPAARNTGLAAATGEYIWHCDSDDFPQTDMLEKMYAAAVESGADIVYCDFYLSFEKNERYMPTPDFEDAEKMLREGFLSGAMKYNVWNKIARRTLYTGNGIIFPEGHPMGEDMTMIQLAAVAKRVRRVGEALYHYVKLNEGAYSNSYSQKKLDDIRFNVDRTVSFLKERFADTLDEDIFRFKLSIKLPFLFTGEKRMYEMWREWYPEADRAAGSGKGVPARTRILQVMAAKGHWWYVKLYYRLVYKLIYGIVFK